jgi:uncharacterized membrane protein YraQ (UPF0718 family)
MLKDKRFVLVVLLMLGVAVNFWAGSRVPQLNEKALMGGDTQINALGFSTVLQVDPMDNLVVRTAYTTVNWVETNRKGMTFGIIFGAILMLLVSLLKKKSTDSGFGNTLIGMIVGAPLGVCVNCAAPIAKGLLAGGARVEMMLAAMISSPTLNVIVLTMLFALYPLYVVGLKLGFTLVFILLVIPVACRVLHPKLVLNDEAEAQLMGDASCEIPIFDAPPATWLEAARWVFFNFFERLWYIVKMTVPLMFLAGFLGSLIITVLPWDTLADLAPGHGSIKYPISLIGVALLGLALPVPITFDILVPAILMSAGLPMEYVMILLFTLGIFSIYPFFIVWGSVGKKMALALSVILIGFGLGAGSAGSYLFERSLEQQRELFYDVFASTKATKGPTGRPPEQHATGLSDPDLGARLALNSLVAHRVSAPGADGIEVAVLPFNPQPGESQPRFRRLLGREVGLDDEASLNVLSFVSLSRFRAISTGDVHNDGWADIALASDGQLSLYANEGGTAFLRQTVDLGAVPNLYLVNVALVDMNNDGWLDLFLSSYRQGNYVIYNQSGSFVDAQIKAVPNREDAVMSGAAAFADIDRDGDLDVALGNFTLGSLAGSWTSNSAMNVLVRNEGDGFHVSPLSGGAGETQSMLFSDINDDGALDLIVGNDFKPADYFYLGDGTGGFERLERDNGLIPHSTWSTMTLASADIDNDLVPELYIGQITGFSGNNAIHRRGIEPETCSELGASEEAERCRDALAIQRTIVRGRSAKDPFRCMGIDERFREDCLAVLLMSSAVQWNHSPELCELYPESWERFAFICGQAFLDDIVPSKDELQTEISQIRNFNALLKRDGDSAYREVAPEMGVDTTGWTWSAKFADVNNDEWQDLFVVNGEFSSSTRESNIFFLNEGGVKFENETESFGLESFLATTSFSYVDIDNDGDLDIVMLPVWGPVAVYMNDVGGRNAISFEVRDEIGNHFGIGTKVIIHYGPNGTRQQIREIQAGGGFVSYDAPAAFFGLGDFDSVDHVEIRWSTGESTIVKGDFAASSRYVLTRRRAGTPASKVAAAEGLDRLSEGSAAPIAQAVFAGADRGADRHFE